MIFGKTKLELKVGIFVFTGLIILTALVLLIGKFQTWRSGYRVHFVFDFINGVKLGAPVRFAGVDIGEVKDITFLRDSQDNSSSVDIDCWVRKEVSIPADSAIWVNTLGLLGEKYIEIMPGKDRVRFLTQGQKLKGEDPLPMQEIGVMAQSIASKIEKLTEDLDSSIVKLNNKEGSLGKLLYDDTMYNELEALVTDIKKHPWKLFYKPKNN